MIAGHARIVKDQVTRQAVAKACGDAVDTGDVFELTIERAMLKTREKGKPVYTKWKSARENSDRGESLIEECKVRYTHPHLDDLAVARPMRSTKTKMNKYLEDVYPWDRARGQANKCRYCKADCLWVVCTVCRDLIAAGKPPRKPIYRPRKKGIIRHHTFGGEVR